MRYTPTELDKVVMIGFGMIDNAVEAVISQYDAPQLENEFQAQIDEELAAKARAESAMLRGMVRATPANHRDYLSSLMGSYIENQLLGAYLRGFGR